MGRFSEQLWGDSGERHYSNQAKGDSDAATWLPPARSYRCGYIAIQIAVKAKYRLWVTPAEHDAMQTVLSNCPDQAVPAGGSR